MKSFGFDEHPEIAVKQTDSIVKEFNKRGDENTLDILYYLYGLHIIAGMNAVKSATDEEVENGFSNCDFSFEFTLDDIQRELRAEMSSVIRNVELFVDTGILVPQGKKHTIRNVKRKFHEYEQEPDLYY